MPLTNNTQINVSPITKVSKINNENDSVIKNALCFTTPSVLTQNNKQTNEFNSYSATDNYQKVHRCKICLQEDSIKNLIHTCNCNGSQKYIHGDCFKILVLEYRTEQCSVCLYKYKINDITKYFIYFLTSNFILFNSWLCTFYYGYLINKSFNKNKETCFFYLNLNYYIISTFAKIFLFSVDLYNWLIDPREIKEKLFIILYKLTTQPKNIFIRLYFDLFVSLILCFIFGYVQTPVVFCLSLLLYSKARLNYTNKIISVGNIIIDNVFIGRRSYSFLNFIKYCEEINMNIYIFLKNENLSFLKNEK